MFSANTGSSALYSRVESISVGIVVDFHTVDQTLHLLSQVLLKNIYILPNVGTMIQHQNHYVYSCFVGCINS